MYDCINRKYANIMCITMLVLCTHIFKGILTTTIQLSVGQHLQKHKEPCFF